MIHPSTVGALAFILIVVAAVKYRRWLYRASVGIPLSGVVQQMVRNAAETPLQPQLAKAVTVPLREGLSIYSNSRLLLADAHRVWLDSKQTVEDRALHQLAIETHEELKRTFRWYLVERVGSLALSRRFPVYSLLLAERYSELVEVLSQIGTRNNDGRTLSLVASVG